MATESSTAGEAVVASRRSVRFERRHGSAVVVKSYPGTEGAALHAVMTGLWASRLGRARPGAPGMPEPLGYDARTGELSTAWVPGSCLGDRGRTAAAYARSVEVGNLLADLHGGGVVIERVTDRPALAASVRRVVADVAADPTTSGPLLEAFHRASRAVDIAWQHDDTPRRHVLCHGDFTPRHLLLNANGVVLLDFERLEMAEFERDLALWAAWLWVADGAHGAPDTIELLGDLVSGYAVVSGRVPADRGGLEVHLAVALVHAAARSVTARHDPLARLRVLDAAATLAERHPAMVAAVG